MPCPMSKTGQSGGWLLCPECEAACRDRPLPPGAELRCRPCGARVRRQRAVNSLQTTWALASTGLILAVLSNVQPILTFDVSGNTQSNLIISGVVGLFVQGYWPVGILVFFGAIGAPAFHLAAVWYVAGGCSLGRRWPAILAVSSLAERLEPWNLVPVFAVAVLVAVVKLDMLGQVEWREGALWVAALSLISLLTVQSFDRRMVEECLERLA
jgi:paraquat-inducible protein A